MKQIASEILKKMLNAIAMYKKIHYRTKEGLPRKANKHTPIVKFNSKALDASRLPKILTQPGKPNSLQVRENIVLHNWRQFSKL